MRVLHTGDIHLELSRYGSHPTARLRDFEATFERFVDKAIELSVDLVVIAGDIFHGSRPSPLGIRVLVRALRRLSEAGIETVVSPGNHDGPGAIMEWEGRTTAWLRDVAMPHVHAYAQPTIDVIETPSGLLTVSVLPYPHKRSFDTDPELARLPIGERTAAVSESAERVIEGMTDGQEDVPHIFVGHLSSLGAELGSEQTMRLGWDVTVRPEVFDAFDYAALGHIHRQQQISAKAWYAGSPDYHDFGEATQPKGWLLADVMAYHEPKVTPIESGTRHMLVFTLPDPTGQFEFARDLHVLEGSITRVEIHDDGPDARKLQRAVLAELRRQGAYYAEAPIIRQDRTTMRARVDLDPEAGIETHLTKWGELNDVPEGMMAKVIAAYRDLADSSRAK